MAAYTRLFLLPQTTYDRLMKKDNKSEHISAINLKQLNNFDVNDGGKVTIKNDTKECPKETSKTTISTNSSSQTNSPIIQDNSTQTDPVGDEPMEVGSSSQPPPPPPTSSMSTQTENRGVSAQSQTDRLQTSPVETQTNEIRTSPVLTQTDRELLSSTGVQTDEKGTSSMEIQTDKVGGLSSSMQTESQPSASSSTQTESQPSASTAPVPTISTQPINSSDIWESGSNGSLPVPWLQPEELWPGKTSDKNLIKKSKKRLDWNKQKPYSKPSGVKKKSTGKTLTIELPRLKLTPEQINKHMRKSSDKLGVGKKKPSKSSDKLGVGKKKPGTRVLKLEVPRLKLTPEQIRKHMTGNKEPTVRNVSNKNGIRIKPPGTRILKLKVPKLSPENISAHISGNKGLKARKEDPPIKLLSDTTKRKSILKPATLKISKMAQGVADEIQNRKKKRKAIDIGRENGPRIKKRDVNK